MRILLLSNLYPPHALGGAEIVAADVASGLEQLGHEVFVLTSSHGLAQAEKSTYIWRTLRIAPPVHFDPGTSTWKQINGLAHYFQRYHCPANAQELQRMITAVNPDVLFINEITGIGVISLLKTLPKLKIPVVFYLQSYLFLYARSPETEQSHLRVRWLKKFLIGSLPEPTFTSLIAVSNAVKQEYIRAGYTPESIEVIYNGVAARFLKPLPDKKGKWAETENASLQLLYAGRLNTEKGILVLLKALDLLINKQGLRKLHLRIFGDGDKSYLNELTSFIDEKQLSSFVTFGGRVPQNELIEYYDRSDIMIVPSLWQEPFALVTAEAMARGLTVVASQVGGTGERISDNIDGLLVKPGDEQALASAIKQLMENPEKLERLAKAARTKVEEHFTIAQCARQVEQHLQRAVQAVPAKDAKQHV